MISLNRTIENLRKHVIFINLENAFDTVSIQRLYEVLDKTSISQQYLQTIKEIYKDQTISNKLFKPFVANKGLRHYVIYILYLIHNTILKKHINCLETKV